MTADQNAHADVIVPLIQGLVHQQLLPPHSAADPTDARALVITDQCVNTLTCCDYDTWQHLPNRPFERRHDLALAVVPLEWPALDQLAPSMTHGITRLRDLLARRVMVLCGPEQAPALRALGFSQVDRADPWQIWQFNILDYKPVPDWFNAKFWANPDNWDKFRW